MTNRLPDDGPANGRNSDHRQSSQTALTACAARAAHLIVDRPPFIFADSLAERLLGDQAEELLEYHRRHGGHPVLAGARTQVICRSRYAEDRLADAIKHGVGQYVILGAGLDTFAYRSGLAERVRVYEVDHPASQAFKRERLAALDLGPGRSAGAGVVLVPVDFETDALAGRLAAAGFDPAAPAVVSWLGVTMYLSREAIAETLAVLGGLAPDTELIVDYMLPESLRDATGQSYVDQVAPAAAERGEPWLSFFAPAELSDLLGQHGFDRVQHRRQRDLIPAGLWERQDAIAPAELSNLAQARVARSAGQPV